MQQFNSYTQWLGSHMSCVSFFTINVASPTVCYIEDQALGLNNKHLLFTLLEAEQSKIKVLGRACFLVCSLRAAPSQHSSSSFYKDVRPIMRVPPLWPNLSLISSQRPHLLIPSHWGWELRCMNFEGDAFSPQRNHFHIANRNRGWWSVARIRGQEEAEEG